LRFAEVRFAVRRAQLDNAAASSRRALASSASSSAAMRARSFAPADDNEADALALLLWAIAARDGVQ
jgi:hypothetical protein